METILLIIAASTTVQQKLTTSFLPPEYRIISVEDIFDALTATRTKHPDIILLNIDPFETTFLDFIAAVRVETNTPIVLLATANTEAVAISGFASGADDYLLASIGEQEMAVRVRAILRRHPHPSTHPSVQRVGEIVLNQAKYTAHVNHVPLNLTPTEFSLLVVLMESPGTVFSRTDLSERIPATEAEGSITAHIRNLRAKIDPHTHLPHIETIYGKGYRFLPDPLSAE